jgi:SAM-dependent methyltransferase
MRRIRSTRRRLESVFWTRQSRTWDERLADERIAARVDELADWLVSALANPGGLVVDLGCGTGNHATALVARGASVVGVERSAGMGAAAAGKGIAVVRADLVDGVPLAVGSIDGAMSVYSLQFLDAAAVLSDVRRVVRVGAPLVVEVPRTDGSAPRRRLPSASWRFRVAQVSNRTAARVGTTVGLVRPLTADGLDRLLHDAGFDVVEHRDTPRSVAVLATARAAGPGRPGDPPSGS